MHRLVVWDARERSRRHAAPCAISEIREFFEDAAQNRFDCVEYIVLSDKRHLDIELVEFTRRPVGPRIFVAETGRYLKIPIEAGNHDQLLELLGRLRQRVKLARMQPARHQKVPRAFGRRRCQDWRLKLRKPLIRHASANRRDHLAAQHDVPVQFFAPKIQEPVTETNVFRVARILVDRHRERLSRPLHLDRLDPQLDFTSRDTRIDRFLAAPIDLTGKRYNRFTGQRL